MAITKENAKDFLPFIKALSEGKKIEYKDYKDEIFIIGGASIYKQFLDLASTLYLTEVKDTCKDASVYFPKFDKSLYNKEFVLANSDNGINYEHVIYRRK